MTISSYDTIHGSNNDKRAGLSKGKQTRPMSLRYLAWTSSYATGNRFDSWKNSVGVISASRITKSMSLSLSTVVSKATCFPSFHIIQYNALLKCCVSEETPFYVKVSLHHSMCSYSVRRSWYSSRGGTRKGRDKRRWFSLDDEWL